MSIKVFIQLLFNLLPISPSHASTFGPFTMYAPISCKQFVIGGSVPHPFARRSWPRLLLDGAPVVQVPSGIANQSFADGSDSTQTPPTVQSLAHPIRCRSLTCTHTVTAAAAPHLTMLPPGLAEEASTWVCGRSLSAAVWTAAGGRAHGNEDMNKGVKHTTQRVRNGQASHSPKGLRRGITNRRQPNLMLGLPEPQAQRGGARANTTGFVAVAQPGPWGRRLCCAPTARVREQSEGTPARGRGWAWQQGAAGRQEYEGDRMEALREAGGGDGRMRRVRGHSRRAGRGRWGAGQAVACGGHGSGRHWGTGHSEAFGRQQEGGMVGGRPFSTAHAHRLRWPSGWWMVDGGWRTNGTNTCAAGLGPSCMSSSSCPQQLSPAPLDVPKLPHTRGCPHEQWANTPGVCRPTGQGPAGQVHTWALVGCAVQAHGQHRPIPSPPCPFPPPSYRTPIYILPQSPSATRQCRRGGCAPVCLWTLLGPPQSATTTNVHLTSAPPSPKHALTLPPRRPPA